MIKERSTQSQPDQMVNGERQRALQHLKGKLDPFQAEPYNERLRVIGLSNLYLQMADPSLDRLEAVSSGLARMPYRNIRELQFATYDAKDNPTRFLARHEIAVDDIERIREGISNTDLLINNIAQRYDSKTGEIRSGKELNSKKIAESAFERIQISKGERQIRKAVEQIKNEPDIEKRYGMGLDLKKHVLEYIAKVPFAFYEPNDIGKPLEPTWENLTKEHQTKDGGSEIGSGELDEAVDKAQAAILRYQFEKRLEQLPTRDKERFHQLRLQYGAKAANLIILSELVGDINNLRKGLFEVKLAVPDFQVVPVDTYRKWKEGKLVDSDLLPYFEWTKGLKDKDKWEDKESNADYMVRSSAVFSEDGENVTGAGIYESQRVHESSTFRDFKNAVITVYKSTDSIQAQAYRAHHGIAGEEMGLVIQKYVSPNSLWGDKSQKGYINSRLAGVPQLMEIVTGKSRNFIRRKELDFLLALDYGISGDAFRDIHHFIPDKEKLDPSLPVKVARLTSVVEKIWGREVQVEFVVDGLSVNFVQVRELPSSIVSQGNEIQFPDEPPIHTAASIGVGDMELPVLDNRDNNSRKAGVVIFRGNFGWTMEDNTHRLPKEGAVIISSDDTGRNGHIQTLCDEQGLICVFPDVNEKNKPTLQYHQLSSLRRVRVVSNGMEARIYKKQQENNSEQDEFNEGFAL